MDTMTPPALFLSHGSPMLAIEQSPAGRFLDQLGGRLPRPRAIIVASAHFTAPGTHIGAATHPSTIHDFNGFPPQLHRMAYPAPGDPALAADIAAYLAAAGLPAALAPTQGLDHGAWVPLRRMYPDADIPVVPVSVDPRADAAAHFAVGRALEPLRQDGMLVVGSGGFIHNLGDLSWGDRDAPMPGWAAEFAQWMRERLLAGDLPALLDWERLAPHARKAHPSTEHLLPLFVALGAGGGAAPARPLHQSLEFGSLALDAFAFG
jgi:4,5-DOPA dioxygenase extradiol